MSQKKCPLEPKKKVFDAKYDAELFATHIFKKYGGEESWKAQHPYQCSGCGKWHLTSVPKGPPVIVLEPFRCHTCGKVPTSWLYTSERELLCSECAKVTYLVGETDAVMNG